MPEKLITVGRGMLVVAALLSICYAMSAHRRHQAGEFPIPEIQRDC